MGVYPIRGRYPTTQASYDTTASAAILAGNEYATMRLLQLAPYTDVPTGVDQLPYNGGRTSGCTLTEHIYESPDSMRRLPASGDTVIEDTRPPYRMFDPNTAMAGSRPQWDQRSRMMQYQQQMTSAITGGSPRSTAVPPSTTTAALPGFNVERYEMPVSVALATGAAHADQQRFAATPATGNYSLWWLWVTRNNFTSNIWTVSLDVRGRSRAEEASLRMRITQTFAVRTRKCLEARCMRRVQNVIASELILSWHYFRLAIVVSCAMTTSNHWISCNLWLSWLRVVCTAQLLFVRKDVAAWSIVTLYILMNSIDQIFE